MVNEERDDRGVWVGCGGDAECGSALGVDGL